MEKFNELPAEIQERMLQEQERQGNYRNAEVFIEDMCSSRGQGGFTWADSVEGPFAWCEILHDGNFAVFYKIYPKLAPVTATNSNN